MEATKEAVKWVYQHLVRAAGGGYTDLEKQQIEKIAELYKAYFNIDRDKLPGVLNLAPECTNPTKLRPNTFINIYWEKELRGNLKEEASGLITTICIYQEYRYKDNSGYLDDPTHLFLHQFKEYLVKLANTSFDIKDLQEAKSWQKFIKDLFRSNIFPPKSSHTNTMQMTLLQIEKKLREVFIPAINAEIENSSAYVQLNSLICHLKSLYDYSVRCLFYVYRNTPNTPSNISLDQLTNKEYRVVRHIIGTTYSGKLLATILQKQYSVQDIRARITNNDMTQQLVYIDYSGETQKQALIQIKSNPLLESKVSKNVLDKLTVFNKKADVGVVSFFRKPRIMDNFLKAHVLLIELAKFCRIFISAKECAKLGGDLLAYGFANKELNADLHECSELLLIFSETFANINLSASEYEEDLVMRNDQESDKDWRQNYALANEYYELLQNEQQLCYSVIGQLRTSANRRTRQQLFEEAMRAKELYVSYHNEHKAYRRVLFDSFHANKQLSEISGSIAAIPLIGDLKLGGVSNATPLLAASSAQISVPAAKKLAKEGRYDEAFDILYNILDADEGNLEANLQCAKNHLGLYVRDSDNVDLDLALGFAQKMIGFMKSQESPHNSKFHSKAKAIKQVTIWVQQSVTNQLDAARITMNTLLASQDRAELFAAAKLLKKLDKIQEAKTVVDELLRLFTPAEKDKQEYKTIYAFRDNIINEQSTQFDSAHAAATRPTAAF